MFLDSRDTNDISTVKTYKSHGTTLAFGYALVQIVCFHIRHFHSAGTAEVGLEVGGVLSGVWVKNTYDLLILRALKISIDYQKSSLPVYG